MLGLPIGRISFLVLIGGVATGLYAAMAWAGTTQLSLPAWLASVGAYMLASFFSYFGHRHLTFRSEIPHRKTVPPFTALVAFGYGIALAVPWLLTDRLGASPIAAIAVTSTIVPIVNAIALCRLVFRTKLLGTHTTKGFWRLF